MSSPEQVSPFFHSFNLWYLLVNTPLDFSLHVLTFIFQFYSYLPNMRFLIIVSLMSLAFPAPLPLDPASASNKRPFPEDEPEPYRRISDTITVHRYETEGSSWRFPLTIYMTKDKSNNNTRILKTTTVCRQPDGTVVGTNYDHTGLGPGWGSHVFHPDGQVNRERRMSDGSVLSQHIDENSDHVRLLDRDRTSQNTLITHLELASRLREARSGVNRKFFFFLSMFEHSNE
jgi:hypothetical protein